MTGAEFAKGHFLTKWKPAHYDTCQILAGIDQLSQQEPEGQQETSAEPTDTTTPA